MNIGVILAGGSGTRMGSDIPKQFIEIYGKPLIIHTIESFDLNSEIDAIAVVCKDQWKEDLSIWIRQFGINKVKWIISGGNTRQESTYKAIKRLEDVCKEDDILIIHDAARPLISQRIINDNIIGAKEYGAVDTVIPSADTQLVLKLDHNVHLVNGDKLNFKVTTFEDLLLLKSVVKIGKAR